MSFEYFTTFDKMRPFMVTKEEFGEALRQHKQCWREPCHLSPVAPCPLLKPVEYLMEMEVVKRVAWDTRHLQTCKSVPCRVNRQVLWCYCIVKACGVGPGGEPP